MEDSEGAARPLKSLESTVKTPVEFVNLTSRQVIIKWLNYDAQQVEFATLEATGNNRSRLKVNTYVTQPWIAEDKMRKKQRMLLNCDEVYYPTEPEVRSFDAERRKIQAKRIKVNITSPGNNCVCLQLTPRVYPWLTSKVTRGLNLVLFPVVGK